jgi:hypothetical protein
MEKNKEKTNEKENNFTTKIKDLLKTPRGKSIFFLILYFFFFVFVFLSLGSNTSTSTNSSDNSTKETLDLSLIEKLNYHFTYQDILGNNTYLYEGDRNGSSSLFTKKYLTNIENFYSNDNIYLKKDLTTNKYVMVDNPYIFSELKQIENIKKMLKKATYISSDSNKYTYQISTTTLISLFENKEIDLDDMPNTIVFYLNASNQVYKIEYSFNSYSIYKGNGTYQSSMEYSNFSNISEIDNPL